MNPPPVAPLAYFDCAAGVSGDMVLGALVDAGLPLQDLQAEIDRLHVGARLRAERVERCGVMATRLEVEIDGAPMKADREQHRHLPAGASHGHTHLHDILAIIDDSDLGAEVKERARGVFRRLTEAESDVHGTPVDAVGLHEVGSLDAVVDIVGALSGLQRLGVTEVRASALHVGTGTVQCAHGRYPLPVPGVVALCRGVPLVQTEVTAELVTPTGAALVTTLACGYGAAPAMTLVAAGYGAGRRDLEALPNVLRLRLGEPVDDTPGARQSCMVVEANLDDMNPEVFGYLFERLLACGARDVWVTPVVMKKSRPGHLLCALVDVNALDPVTDVILGETTSLGVRYHEATRRLLPRRSERVATPWGAVRVKVALLEDRRRVAPEYDDCADLARRHHVPILTVYAAAVAAAEAGRQP